MLKVIKFTGFFILILLYSCKVKSDESIKIENYIEREYYPDGQFKRIGAVINGKKQGLWLRFDTCMIIEIECVYVDDIINGKCIFYYPNQNIQVEGYMIDGVWVGERIFYYENGKVMNKGNYKNGKLDGIWEYYDDKGDLDKKVLYNNGKIVEVIIDNKLIPSHPGFPQN